MGSIIDEPAIITSPATQWGFLLPTAPTSDGCHDYTNNLIAMSSSLDFGNDGQIPSPQAPPHAGFNCLLGDATQQNYKFELCRVN